MPQPRNLLEENRRFYDSLWTGARLVEPNRFNTWPLVGSLLSTSTRRLEVGPGLRPRLPIAGTTFVDISAPALAKLRGRGALAVLGKVSILSSMSMMRMVHGPSYRGWRVPAACS
jgi:hypothetical protein